MQKTSDQPIINIQDGDQIFTKLRNLGNSLKPIDDENYFFFEIIRELLDSALTNYGLLRLGYVENYNDHLVAWTCRNLLELTVFTEYVLKSGANGQRFVQDRLIDGCDIITSLRDLERHHDPHSDTALLDQWLVAMQNQMVAEAVIAKKYLSTNTIADTVGMKAEYAAMNKVCSKLVHPTAYSVLAINKGTNSFPQAREILFACGVGYMSQMYLAVNSHNASQGMRPNP
jgi:hypothetical protein